MLDTTTREAKEWLLQPFAPILKDVHPNTVTLASFLFGVMAIVFATQGLYGWTFAAWVMNRGADGLDGTLARIYKKQSDLGGYIDILADFTIYALLPVGLVFGAPDAFSWIMVVVLLSTYYINAASWMYLSAILEKRNVGVGRTGEKTSVTMPAGLIEGTETILFYCMFIVFNMYLPWLFGIFALLIGTTVIQRLVWAMDHLD